MTGVQTCALPISGCFRLIVPKWSYQAEAAGGFHVVDSDSAGTSMSVTAKGEADKADQVSFTCENEMLHKETASFEIGRASCRERV